MSLKRRVARLERLVPIPAKPNHAAEQIAALTYDELKAVHSAVKAAQHDPEAMDRLNSVFERCGGDYRQLAAALMAGAAP